MFNPDQKAVLQEIISDPAAVAATVLSSSVEEIRAFIARGDGFVRKYGRQLIDKTFILALDETTEGEASLTSKIVLKQCRSGDSILIVDRNLKYIRAVNGAAGIMESQQRTQAAKSLELVYWGPNLGWCIVAGEIVSERRFGTGSREPPLPSPWRRPMSEFDRLISDHVEEEITNERRIRYWANKRRRVLLSKPDGTERLFHASLFWWLDHFVEDSLRVVAGTRGFGQDTTDITVITMSGDYVVEVKWLGENDARTKYTQPPRIDEGLQQVKTYLENDPRLVVGFLVVYDARPADQNLSRSIWEPSARHERCEKPWIIFLESDTPSQAARRAAKR